MYQSTITLNNKGHNLGDCLLALPVCRPGDTIICDKKHWLPIGNINWKEKGKGIKINRVSSVHSTREWAKVTGRIPERFFIKEHSPDLLVYAPMVMAARKKWNKWQELINTKKPDVVIGATVGREEWIDILSKAHTVVCPDTGTAHMADALGVPKVIALYRTDMWKTFHPYWNNKYCIHKKKVEDITVAEVLEKINND